jgi:hypothetical protein
MKRHFAAVKRQKSDTKLLPLDIEVTDGIVSVTRISDIGLRADLLTAASRVLRETSHLIPFLNTLWKNLPDAWDRAR